MPYPRIEITYYFVHTNTRELPIYKFNLLDGKRAARLPSEPLV